MTNVLKVKGSKIVDPCGKPILLRGVNKMFIFEQELEKRIGANIYPEIVQTGANCVRIVWGMNRIEQSSGSVVKSSVAELDSVITNCKAQKMIPIVGLWDFTGDAPDSGFSRLSEYVDFWVRPDVLAILKKHENALIINIANEAAPESDDTKETLNALTPIYINTYSTAISRMREAGIKVPLMIDGLDFGKSLKCFSFVRTGQNINVATELLNADGEKNLIFSFHAYWAKSFTDSRDGSKMVNSVFKQAVADGYCFIIGELSKYGAWADNESICSDKGEVDFKRFAKLCSTNKVGYVLWEWGPGNENGNPPDKLCEKMNMTLDGTFRGLKDWGEFMVKDSKIGFSVGGRFTNYSKNNFLKCKA